METQRKIGRQSNGGQDYCTKLSIDFSFNFQTRDFMQSTLVIAGLKTKHKRLNHDFLQCLAFACHWIFEPAEELHEVEARPQRDAVEMFLAGDAGLNEGGMEVEEGRLERFEKVLDDWGGGDEVEVG
jgi:hypothetical protein